MHRSCLDGLAYRLNGSYSLKAQWGRLGEVECEDPSHLGHLLVYKTLCLNDLSCYGSLLPLYWEREINVGKKNQVWGKFFWPNTTLGFNPSVVPWRASALEPRNSLAVSSQGFH